MQKQPCKRNIGKKRKLKKNVEKKRTFTSQLLVTLKKNIMEKIMEKS